MSAGKLYAAPLVNSLVTVIYNRDVFARLGVQPPTTWSQFLANCNRIADSGVAPVAMAGADAVSVGFLGTALSANTVYTTDPNWSAKRNAGKVTFRGTPGWQRALALIQDMKGARCFQPSPATTSAAAAYGLFNAGQAAMMIASSVDTVTNVLQPNPTLNFGLFPLPGESAKSTRVLANPAVNLTVNAASPVKEQALQFVDFVQRSWQSVGGRKRRELDRLDRHRERVHTRPLVAVQAVHRGAPSHRRPAELGKQRQRRRRLPRRTHLTPSRNQIGRPGRSRKSTPNVVRGGGDLSTTR